MKTDRYEQLIAETLRRPDIAAAGSLAYAAAKCVQYASEFSINRDLGDAIRSLEEAAGISYDFMSGEYRETTED